MHQAPEIAQAIFYRCASRQQFEIRLEPFSGNSLQCIGILDVLRLVEDDHAPVDSAQGELIITQGLIGREH